MNTVNSGGEFSRRPDQHELAHRFKLRKVNEGSPITFVFLRPDVWGRFTHWDAGANRTVPCFKAVCGLCEQFKRRDWKGWIPILNRNTKAQEVLELPRSAMPHIDFHLSKKGTCMGWIATAARQDGHKQGTVAVTFSRIYNEPTPLPEAIDVEEYMYKIWRIMPPAPTPRKQTGDITGLWKQPELQNPRILESD